MIVVVRGSGGQSADESSLGLAVAYGIVRVAIVISIRVIGFLQTVEGIIDVVDGDRTALL